MQQSCIPISRVTPQLQQLPASNRKVTISPVVVASLAPGLSEDLPVSPMPALSFNRQGWFLRPCGLRWQVRAMKISSPGRAAKQPSQANAFDT